MRSELVRRLSVDREELKQKRQKLARLQSELVEQELRLATLRAELNAFEEKYRRQVGILYAELDDWKARVAELIAEHEDTHESRSAAAQARAQAKESYSEAHGEAAKATECPPSPELKKLYRDVAKAIHPDLATDQEDRICRERLMKEANLAYQRGDAHSLRKILEEYESSPEGVKGSGTAADLARVVRQIAQTQKRLGQIEDEIRSLIESDIARIKAKAEKASKEGRDVLTEMAEIAMRSILAERTLFEELSASRKSL